MLHRDCGAADLRPVGQVANVGGRRHLRQESTKERARKRMVIGRLSGAGASVGLLSYCTRFCCGGAVLAGWQPLRAVSVASARGRWPSRGALIIIARTELCGAPWMGRFESISCVSRTVSKRCWNSCGRHSGVLTLTRRVYVGKGLRGSRGRHGSRAPRAVRRPPPVPAGSAPIKNTKNSAQLVVVSITYVHRNQLVYTACKIRGKQRNNQRPASRRPPRARAGPAPARDKGDTTRRGKAPAECFSSS